jgi:hypothetical protein
MLGTNYSSRLVFCAAVHKQTLKEGRKIIPAKKSAVRFVQYWWVLFI